MNYSYTQAIEYILNLPKFTIKHPLSHTKEFIKRLGNPAFEKRIIHIAGTNGKGSTCRYMETLLLKRGSKVGSFFSPHLIKVNERIRINGIDISDEDFTNAFNQVLPIALEMEEEKLGHPSFFEFLFGIFLKAMYSSPVEYLILETGLGGRLDATNIFSKPIITIITSIGLDHTAILGDTISEIANEKAGIIMPNVPVIFDGSNIEANKVIEKVANEKNSNTYLSLHHKINKIKDLLYIENSENKLDENYISNGNEEVIVPNDFALLNTFIQQLKLKQKGIYQKNNLSLAIAAIYLIFGKEDFLHNKIKYKNVLENFVFPGRMEEIKPHIFVDGAHNPEAIRGFVETIKDLDTYEKAKQIIIFSSLKDKDYKTMIYNLLKDKIFDYFILTEIPDGSRTLSVSIIEETFYNTINSIYNSKEKTPQVISTKNIRDAFAKGEKYIQEKNDKCDLYIIGSLYLVGDIKQLL
ncbi:MAG: bifunctional folylpolyglutamate synthase/dihydrofolate synthase [Lachnospiraceae bacterium]|jgi:dihydrofolate synthase/folylpolyglutamate synthase|nr:bifunctional folylpolyglutamate synthase/dihydrofolate synthase [Lachnospiraceae bacterium]